MVPRMTSVLWLQLQQPVSKAILHGYEFANIWLTFLSPTNYCSSVPSRPSPVRTMLIISLSLIKSDYRHTFRSHTRILAAAAAAAPRALTAGYASERG